MEEKERDAGESSCRQEDESCGNGVRSNDPTTKTDLSEMQHHGDALRVLSYNIRFDCKCPPSVPFTSMQDEQEFQWWERRERLARVISEDVQPHVLGLQEVRIAASVQGKKQVTERLGVGSSCALSLSPTFPS
jgi:hypothetical protein